MDDCWTSLNQVTKQVQKLAAAGDYARAASLYSLALPACTGLEDKNIKAHVKAAEDFGRLDSAWELAAKDPAAAASALVQFVLLAPPGDRYVSVSELHALITRLEPLVPNLPKKITHALQFSVEIRSKSSSNSNLEPTIFTNELVDVLSQLGGTPHLASESALTISFEYVSPGEANASVKLISDPATVKYVFAVTSDRRSSVDAAKCLANAVVCHLLARILADLGIPAKLP